MNKYEYELLRQVDSIEDEEIKNFTKVLLSKAPPQFWYGRASREHHPPDERGQYGNLIHTIRTVKLVSMMLESCDARPIICDIVTSATVLHDLCRNGLEWENEHSVPEHPHLVRELAESHSISCGHSETIFGLIETHMGRWGDPPHIPSVSYSGIIHLADMISARAEQVWDKLR